MLGLFWTHYQKPISLIRWGVRTLLVGAIAGAAFFQLGVVSDPMKIYGKTNHAKYWRPAADLPERDFLNEDYFLNFSGQEGIQEMDLQGDRIGRSLAATGDWLIVGAERDSRYPAPVHGWAYAFRFSQEVDDGLGKWMRDHDLPPPDSNGGGQYGHAISASPDGLIIGESRAKRRHNPVAVGQIHFFNLKDGLWKHQKTLQPPPPPDWTFPKNAGNNRLRSFGRSFFREGPGLFVNAPDEWNGPGLKKGAWYCYEQDAANNWNLRQRGPDQSIGTERGVGSFEGTIVSTYQSGPTNDHEIRIKLMRQAESGGRWHVIDHERDIRKMPPQAPDFSSGDAILLTGKFPYIVWISENEDDWKRWRPEFPFENPSAFSMIDWHQKFGILARFTNPREQLLLFYPIQNARPSPKPILLRNRRQMSPPTAIIADNGDIVIGDVQADQTNRYSGQVAVIRRASIVAKLASIKSTEEAKPSLPLPSKR